MSFLIDTNIISEVRKGARCNARVAAWFETITDDSLYLSVLVLVEIRIGIELARPRNSTRAKALELCLKEVAAVFGDHILPIDEAISDERGRMSAIRPIPMIDGLLAATAKVHQMTLLTRNDGNVAGRGAKVLNPFN